jgi:hypothetical protein
MATNAKFHPVHGRDHDHHLESIGGFSGQKFKPKETYSLKSDAEPEYISEYSNIDVNIDALIELLRYDYEAFILLMLHEQEGIEKGVPDFHILGFKYMSNEADTRVVIALPRDHAKTTLAKINAVHQFIYTSHRFLVYTSHTSTIAIQACRDIVNFIQAPQVVAIYGAPLFTQKEEAKGNYMFQWRARKYIIRSLGAGQQVRGMNVDNQRPSLSIIDDLESAEQDESNKIGYEGLKKWFYGTFMKAMDRRNNKIIQIGNLVSNKSILYDHLQSPTWRKLLLSCITPSGKPLWPARWTISELRLDLLDYIRQGQMYVWLAEMMNMPITEANKLIDARQMATTDQVYPDTPNLYIRCITVDPAISDQMEHANAAVVCVHVFNGEYWQLAEKDSSYGASPYDLYNTIMKLCFKWHVKVVGIEDNGYQRSLIHVAEHEASIAGFKGFSFVPLKSGRKSKHARILTFVGMIKAGLYRFSIENFDIFTQMNNYDITSDKNKDDEIDCCAYLPQMVTSYLGLMTTIRDTGSTNQIIPDPTTHHR